MQFHLLDSDSVTELREMLLAVLEHVKGLPAADGRTAASHNPDPLGWISNAELLEHLRISKSTLQRWRDSGQLAYRKVNGLIFYRREDVEAFIDTFGEKG